MRIIAGSLGGRTIKTPKSYKTHPMSERIRQAMFNSLGSMEDLEVWDAFAGSGSLALEAVSRGAKYALATDKDRAAISILKENVAELKVEESVQIVAANARAWSSTNPEKKFDIIFCDPPYNDLQLSTVFGLSKHLKPKGLMVLSQSGRDRVTSANGVVVVDNRNYGDATLVYYQLKGSQ